MHDIGDGLVRAGLSDPVLDVDRLGVSYENPGKLFSDLSLVGARNTASDRNRGLTGKERFRRMADALTGSTPGAGIHLDLELVYGHCWGAGPKNDPAAWRVDAGQIPLRR
jgi:malonyl-CoA O-methyltransferase